MATLKVIYDLFIRNKSKGVLPRLEKQVKGLEKPINRVNTSFKAFGATLAGVGATAFIVSAIKITATTEAMNKAILLSASTAKIGATNLRFLEKTVENLRLDSASAKEGFKTLAGSFQNTKLEGAEMRRLFLSVSKASKVMGLSADQQKGTFLALGQIMSKGKVQAEELRGQLGERIPGAFQLAANAMGVTTAELNKMLETGKVISEDFLPKFATELEKTFGKKAAKITDSLQGSLNVLNNSFRKIKLSVGRAVAPAISKLARALRIATKDNTAFSRSFAEQSAKLIKNSVSLNNNFRILKQFNIDNKKRARIINEVNTELEKLGLTQVGNTSSLIELNRLQEESNKLLLKQAVQAKRREATAKLIEKQAQIEIEKAQFITRIEGLKLDIIEKIRTVKVAAAAEGRKLTEAEIKAFKVSEKLAKSQIEAAKAREIINKTGGVFTKQVIVDLRGITSSIRSSEQAIKGTKKRSSELTKELSKQQLITDAVLKNFNAQKKASDDLAEPFTPDGGTDGGTGKNISQQVNNIAGRAPKNIIINIDKLVEQLNVNAATLPEGSDEIETQIVRTLLSAVNDANIIDP